MTKQQLLDWFRKNNPRKGDIIIMELNENDRDYDTLDDEEVILHHWYFGWCHRNRYGEAKANPSTGDSWRTSNVSVLYENGLYTSIRAEGIVSIRLLTSNTRRRKNPYMDIEDFIS